MKSTLRAVGILFLAGFAAAASFGATITVGVPIGSSNAFPFTGTSPGGMGSRYQQAYSASDFTEAMAITDISFFRQQTGTFRTATYSLYLSTISAGIDSLSVANFDANRGSDNTLFATLSLSGSLPAVLTFSGGPFLYNPTSGNLLLDVTVTGIGTSGNGGFEWQSSSSGTFSRYYDFSNPALASVGTGLVTRFDYNTAIPEPQSFGLIGLGLAGLLGIKRKIRSARG